MAGIRGLAVAGGATNVVGVKMAASGVTAAASIDGVHMDVVSWDMLVYQLGKSVRVGKKYRRDLLLQRGQ